MIIIRSRLEEMYATLALAELAKPSSERKRVPTITQLAEEIGVSRVSVSNYFNDNRKQVDLEILGKIVDALTKHGFDVKPNDLFSIEEEVVGKVVPVREARRGVSLGSALMPG